LAIGLACFATTQASGAIAFKFGETVDSMSFEVMGGDIRVPDTQTFSTVGAFWEVEAKVEEKKTALVESVAISGRARHIDGPHVDDGVGEYFNFVVKLDPSPMGYLPQSGGGTAGHMNGHVDVFGWRASAEGSMGNINSWEFDLAGTHVVPEPGAFLVWSVLGLGALVWQRRRRVSS
jgi:hypothetical protein